MTVSIFSVDKMNISEETKQAIINRIAERVTAKIIFNEIVAMIENGKIGKAIEKATIASPMPNIEIGIYMEIIEKGMKGE